MKALTLLKYHGHSLWNWRSSYLGRFLEPVAYLVFLTAGLSGTVGGSPGACLAYAMTGLVCFVAFRSATSTVGDVANDRKWGILAIYTMQGGSIAGYLLSIVLFATAVFVGQLAVLVGIGSALFGFPALGGTPLLLACLTGLLVLIGWVGIGAAVGAQVQSYSVRDLVVTVTALPIVLSAPLFYSLEAAPRYLQTIAHFNPLTYQAAWLRTPSGELGLVLLAAGVWALAGLAVAYILLRRADRVSRER
ncbi:ABC transporter permease [Frondihabitans cladoniiphilus]|uniref:ABC-2 type transporter transmembrane domain-containing protein n=1 Tax=Frondihabitans cladoniiphilus TaxID=715785 RepID=A0ABP8VWK9_9MICO